MATQAKAKKVRYIEADKIQTSLQWTDAYKNKYKNIVLSSEGEMTILDPSLTEVVKTIPHSQGYDATVVLATQYNTELRAGALATQEGIHSSLAQATLAANNRFVAAEKELLSTLEDWKQTEDPAVRRTLALNIGILTNRLQTRETDVRSSLYPYRYLRQRWIPKLMIDYPSRNPKETLVGLVTLQTTLPADRAFTVEGTA
jgi:hypothetical protein